MGFRTTQIIRRKSGGHVNDDGIYIGGQSQEIKIQASVQPTILRERTQRTGYDNPGGRTINLLKVYSDIELFPTKQATENTEITEGDVLIWRDKTWRCIGCDAFKSNVISHYRAIFQEVDCDD